MIVIRIPNGPVPFNERLLRLGVHRTMALHLFENRHLSLAQAAKLAAMPPEEFLVLLGEAGIPAADYPPEELVRAACRWPPALPV